MGWFVLYLFLALQAAACVIALVSRAWTLRPDPIVWRGTDVAVAASNVEQFLIDIDDSRFAYPTGMFVPDASSDAATGRVRMREDNFGGSRGLGWAFYVFAAAQAAFRRERAIGRYSPFVLICLWPLLMFVAGALAAPFLVTAVFDMGYRKAFRSRIDADITKHPQIQDAVRISLEFRGLSAFGLVTDVLRGMSAPVLPPGLAAGPRGSTGQAESDTRSLSKIGGRAAAWAQSAEQRFRVIYGSATAAAVLVAAILALVIHHGGGLVSDAPVANVESQAEEAQGGSSGTEASDSDDSSPADGSTSDTTTATGDGFRTADGYTVTPPAGWVRDSDSKDKGGFTESRWHLSGSPRTYVLVDHSAGFSGTAHEGALPVRRALSRVAGYVEYKWAPVGDQAWDWEFAAKGLRKIDHFTTACGGGYAILGAAPQSEFEARRATFAAFRDSFVAPCDGDETATSAKADESAKPAVPHISANSPTRVLRRHYKRIEDGDYDGAFALLSSRYRSANPRWTAQPSAARPYINVMKVGPSDISGTHASVYVKFYARDRIDTPRSDTRCRRFEGRAEMTKDGTHWRYEPSGNDYVVTEVDSSLRACNP
jgi:hypothetical protein